MKDCIIPDTPCIVKFTATWCGPCHRIQPTLEALSREYDVPLVKIDVDENEALSTQYGVRGLPTTLVLLQGRAVAGRVVGANEPEITRLCAAHFCRWPAAAAGSIGAPPPISTGAQVAPEARRRSSSAPPSVTPASRATPQ